MHHFMRICVISVLLTGANFAAFIPTDSANKPIGIGRGIFPGRVVLTHDTAATSWDGKTGFWWHDANTNPARVKSMLSKSLRTIAGKSSDKASWEALFTSFNKVHGKSGGYRPGEKIAIKANLNTSQKLEWNNDQATSPQLLLALVDQLVHNAGVPESCITIADPTRIVGNPIYDPIHKQFPRVNFVDQRGEAGRIKAQPDTSAAAAIWFADSTVPLSGKTYIASCFSKADYLINLASLRGHSLAGVTLCAKNHFGSIWKNFAIDSSTLYFGKWGPVGPGPMVGLHGYVSVHPFDVPAIGWKFPERPMGSYTPLVELMGHKNLDGKALLFMIDGLYAAQHQSSTGLVRWRSAPFGTPDHADWTSSILVSQDAVALESVGLDFLRNDPAYDSVVTGTVDNYLHEAALADNPPSHAAYDPEHDGSRLKSLGVHEHWNNARDKKYSRNFGKNEGIELIVQ